MQNVWTPARTLANPKVLLLGAALGIIAGAAIALSAAGIAPFGYPSGWKRAASWAKDSRLNAHQKAALRWMDGNIGDPVIELLEVEDSRPDPEGNPYWIVGIRYRSKVSGGASEVKTRYVAAWDDGDARGVDPMYSGWPATVKDGVVMSGR